MWIEDDDGDSTAWLADKKGGRELQGRWLDMRDKPVFDARRYHMVEPHEGSMWALAAYVPQAYARATEQHRGGRWKKLDFRCRSGRFRRTLLEEIRFWSSVRFRRTLLDS